MQHTVLRLLFSLLTISQAAAQNHHAFGMPRWPQALERAMALSGIDQLSMHPPSRPSQDNALQLDSTKNFIFTSPSTPGDSMPVARTVYQYPQPNVVVQLYALFENGVWRPRSRTTTTTDNLGRVVRFESEDFDTIAQTYHPGLLIEGYPHGNTLENYDSLFLFQWSPATMALQQSLAIRSVYDAQDRLLEERTTVNSSGTLYQARQVYSYDAQGDNYLVESFTLNGSTETLTSRTQNTYVNHLLATKTNSSYIGTEIVPQFRYTYTYTSFGSVQEAQTLQWDEPTSSWMLLQTATYTYDPQHREIQRILHTDMTDTETRTRVDYTYVEDELLALEVDYDWDFVAHVWVLTHKTYYYYDDVSATRMPFVRSLPLQMLPNPTAGLVRLQLDDAATVQVCNAAGQVVQTHFVQPGQVLDMTALPRGLYVLTARCGQRTYTGNVVKQ